MKTEKKVELLAPAGSIEAFYGAIHAGADAVYLGGSRFGARAYADNFTEEELVSCIRYAHLFGRKVYLTVNTLVKESEFSELFEYLLPYYEAGLDGAIIQDLGVFAFLREHFPGLELHVSTQMAITGKYGAALLKKMGACRIVPARELSLKELIEIKKETGLEIEAFIHGAMCYCYSGQCLFSSILGGRSGNRGRCAQPCRLPYSATVNGASTKEGYPLSLKDMCTLEHLPELIEAGIDSFKIEGRMKKAEYAAGVTAIYRKAIDSYYEAKENGKPFTISKDALRELSALYIRSERQDGYYYKHNGADMVTLHNPAYSGTDEELLLRIRQIYLEHTLKGSVRISGRFVIGQPSELTFVLPVCDKNIKLFGLSEPICVTATGNMVQPAMKQPITEENIRKQLGKLGDSIFAAEAMEITCSPDAFYPLKQINELRRAAVQRLEEAVLARNGYQGAEAGKAIPPDMTKADSRNSRTAFPCKAVPAARSVSKEASLPFSVSVLTKEQLIAVANLQKLPKRLYLSGDLLFENQEQLLSLCGRLSDKCDIIVSLPYILRSHDAFYLEQLYKIVLKSADILKGFQIRSLEGLGFLLEKKYQGAIYSDANVYTWNQKALQELSQIGNLSGFCLPVELNSKEQRELFAKGGGLPAGLSCEKIVYGRLPMMITANCVAKTTRGCLKGKEEKQVFLTDRYKKQFPVVLNCIHCMNVIYNTVPLSLHNELTRQWEKLTPRLDFTLEDEKETARILQYFAENPGAKLPFSEYTTGHEKRGVM